MTIERFEIDTANRHTITSNVTLCCAETGRVIAVFYNDYDAEALLAAAPRPEAGQHQEPVALLHIAEGKTTATYRVDPLSVLPIGTHKLYASHAQPNPDYQKDAERYRWLLSQDTSTWNRLALVPDNETDAVIDAALNGDSA